MACHVEEAERWRGSHHDLAMQEPAPSNVLAEFGGDTLRLGDETYVPFRRGDDFFVRAAGPDGEAEFPVRYTFGVDPLQQYLVELPGGRLQALTLAWDARPAEEGGQRWFDLVEVHGEPIAPGDSRHWTGADQTWNFMCATCHSTGVQKRYDPVEDRYDTRWSELDVACEACHAPGSRHVAWAEGARTGENPGLPARLARLRPGDWRQDPDTGSPFPREGPDPGGQLETCAVCHSHRAPLADEEAPGDAFLDAHRPSLLDEELYFADGRIRGEVYEWGSFLQSAMYRGGVVCSDCHEPHSLELRAPGNALCAQCHAPERFDTPEHHLHPSGTSGAECVACHMPVRTYMSVDPRRDHSFSVPRPGLSEVVGSPDSCMGCHVSMSSEEAERALAQRPSGTTEPRREPRRRAEAVAAHALASAHAGRTGSSRHLAAVARDTLLAPITRATALSLLGRVPRAPGARAIEAAAGSPDPVVRLGAARGLEGYPPEVMAALGRPLLEDSFRAIRVEVARILASVEHSRLPPEMRPLLAAALEEYRDTQRVNLDRPEARVNLGWLALQEGDAAAAEREYRAALGLRPDFVGGYVNLADLLRMQGRDEDAESVLRAGLARASRSPELMHALALTLVRLGRTPEAVPLLREASELAPRDARFAYVYAVALHSDGDTQAAVEWLEAFLVDSPGNREALLGLAEIHLDAGDREAAALWAEEILEMDPDDPEARRLLEQTRPPP